MRLSAPEIRARAEQAKAHYQNCDLCGHDCRVDRTKGPAGRCYEGTGVVLAGAGVHFGEEPPLVGDGPGRPGENAPGMRRGSGLVLVGGCNLACRSCETADFSLERKGVVPFSESQLASLFLKQQSEGAANLNLVTPTHVMPALLSGLAAAAERGFVIPVVWNCGGYESLAALELLDGIVDIYLPDAKYGRDAEGESVSGSPGYTKALRESLKEMWRQTGPIQLDARGLATRGTIVRHLVLPNDAAGSREAMQLCAEVSPDLWVNVMSQYRPLHNAKRLPVIARRCSKTEIGFAVQAALDAGLRNVLLDGTPTGSEELLVSRKAAKVQRLGSGIP